MNVIYIFSGLGVDKRVFGNINFGGLNIKYVDWIEPIAKETLENYAKRISRNIETENPILIGLSFGGIVAIEISKVVSTKKLILIASAKTKNELPTIYRIVGKLKLDKLIPTSVFKQPNFVTNWFFGIKEKSEKQLLKNILKDTSSKYLNWAIHETANWKNKTVPEHCTHIHGNKDRIIPIKNVIEVGVLSRCLNSVSLGKLNVQIWSKSSKA